MARATVPVPYVPSQTMSSTGASRVAEGSERELDDDDRGSDATAVLPNTFKVRSRTDGMGFVGVPGT